MEPPEIDGPPDYYLTEPITDLIRDEVGSQLCKWVDDGTRRVCRINVGETCLCRSTAEAVLQKLFELEVIT